MYPVEKYAIHIEYVINITPIQTSKVNCVSINQRS